MRTVLADIEELFGLKAQGEEGDKLVLTDYEMEQLRAAYEKSINGTACQSVRPSGVCALRHLRASHLSPSPTSSTTSPASPSPLTATPVCPWQCWPRAQAASMFNGYYDNTDIYNKLADLLNIA